MSESGKAYLVRETRPEDFAGIARVTAEVYPGTPVWSADQLASHLRVFAEGQFVAVEAETQCVCGMASSLVVLWDDYDFHAGWRDFTDKGLFTNHDLSRGRTLYGAEVMVRPSLQGHGLGKKLYAARRALVQRMGLLRIRAGARLRDYHTHAGKMSAPDYVRRVVRGSLTDRTLSFQLKQGFHVIGTVSNYLLHDPESLGHAAVIEWLNEAVAQPADHQERDKWLEQSGVSAGGPGGFDGA